MLSRGTVTANSGLSGVDESAFQMKKIETALKSSLPLEQLAGKIAEEAARLVPIDTGELCSSIRFAKIDNHNAEIYAGYDKPGQGYYAAYVEFGTWKMDAQPYMRPAADAMCKQYGFHGYIQMLVNEAAR
jgi:HK97 gp10 family phage protein